METPEALDAGFWSMVTSEWACYLVTSRKIDRNPFMYNRELEADAGVPRSV